MAPSRGEFEGAGRRGTLAKSRTFGTALLVGVAVVTLLHLLTKGR
ncbi:hypothetical protein [Streptomyces sp. NA04227]|nr:hypothetical protein [Streptomyces sp. NA04227]